MKKKYRIREGSIAEYVLGALGFIAIVFLFSLPSAIENLFF